MFPRRRRLGLRRRIAKFVRAVSRGRWSPGWGDLDGGVGVREPRRPLTPSLTGATALELPTDDDEN
jgi:hypothetical protein